MAQSNLSSVFVWSVEFPVRKVCVCYTLGRFLASIVNFLYLILIKNELILLNISKYKRRHHISGLNLCWKIISKFHVGLARIANCFDEMFSSKQKDFVNDKKNGNYRTILIFNNSSYFSNDKNFEMFALIFNSGATRDFIIIEMAD